MKHNLKEVLLFWTFCIQNTFQFDEVSIFKVKYTGIINYLLTFKSFYLSKNKPFESNYKEYLSYE